VTSDPSRARRKTAASAPRRKQARKASVSRDAASLLTRVEILRAAAAAFRRVGYHGATLEQIASTLRMKKGNLYYYFRNKEDILFACHQYSVDRLLAVLDDVEHGELTPEQKLRALIVAFVNTIIDDLHGTALFLDIRALGARRLREAIAQRDRFDRGVRRVIQQGIDWGVFNPAADPKLISFAMLGAVNWIPRWYSPEGPADSQQIADRFADYLVAGLRSI
jgi:AcrR family transcriptional regulator